MAKPGTNIRIPDDIVVRIFTGADKETLAIGARISKDFWHPCQMLLFRSLVIMKDLDLAGERREEEEGEEEPTPNCLHRLFSEWDPKDSRFRLAAYVKEIRIGPPDETAPWQHANLIPIPPCFLNDLAQLPHLESVHFSWAMFKWRNLTFKQLKKLVEIFSKVKTIRYHQSAHMSFPLPLLSYCKNLEHLDLHDFYPSSYYDDPKFARKLSRALVAPAPKFPSLTKLTVSGQELFPELESFIALNTQGGLPKLQNLELSYCENGICLFPVVRYDVSKLAYGNCGKFTEKAYDSNCPLSIHVGRFLESFGPSLTTLKLTVAKPFKGMGCKLMSTNCCPVLVRLTHLEVVTTAVTWETPLDVIEYSKKWQYMFLKALPAIDELSSLRLTIMHDFDKQKDDQSVAIKSALENFLDVLASIIIKSHFEELKLCVFCVRLNELHRHERRAIPWLWKNELIVDEDNEAFSRNSYPQSIDRLEEKGVKVILDIPGYDGGSG